MENTEKLIVEQLKNGNEDAYKYIYDYHYVLLCHVANQYLNDNFLSENYSWRCNISPLGDQRNFKHYYFY